MKPSRTIIAFFVVLCPVTAEAQDNDRYVRIHDTPTVTVGRVVREDDSAITVLVADALTGVSDEISYGEEKTFQKRTIRTGQYSIMKNDQGEWERAEVIYRRPGIQSLTRDQLIASLRPQPKFRYFPYDFSHRVAQFTQSTPTIGAIAKVGSSYHYATLGSNDGVLKGHSLHIYRPTEKIRDPNTGEVLGSDRTLIAHAEVVDSRPAFSKIRVSNEVEIQLQVGDEVEPTLKKRAVAVFPLIATGSYPAELPTALNNRLIDALVTEGALLVDRGTLLKAIDEELKRQQGNDFDPTLARSLAKRVGAGLVLGGTIVASRPQPDARKRDVETSATATILLTDVETGEVLYTYRYRFGYVAPDIFRQY